MCKDGNKLICGFPAIVDHLAPHLSMDTHLSKNEKFLVATYTKYLERILLKAVVSC
jgi:hypothetical protein